jgi:hypothetical protein
MCKKDEMILFINSNFEITYCMIENFRTNLAECCAFDFLKSVINAYTLHINKRADR